MFPDRRTVALVCLAALVPVAAGAAAPGPGTHGNGPAAGAAPPGRAPAGQPAPPSQPTYPEPPTTVSADAAARARMHECGHQWSSMKRAGTVGLMTWKEFSATCLVVR